MLAFKIFIQIVVMVSDIAIPVAAAIVVNSNPLDPLMWIIAIVGLWAWTHDGLRPFEAWKPSTMKKFFKSQLW